MLSALRYILSRLAALALLASCAVTHSVRPVGDGKWELGASLGGPFIAVYRKIPVVLPIPTVYTRYGITNRIDADATVLLPATPVAGLALGGAWQAFGQDGGIPALMLGGRAHAFLDTLTFADWRFVQELYATTSWRLTKRAIWYIGVNLWLNDVEFAVAPSLYGGVQWLPSNHWRFNLELKWMDFVRNRTDSPAEVFGPGGLGVAAMQVGLAYRF